MGASGNEGFGLKPTNLPIFETRAKNLFPVDAFERFKEAGARCLRESLTIVAQVSSDCANPSQSTALRAAMQVIVQEKK
ncbi:hypothetical protein AG1IA_10246 [Rhizoctonia solani AG-1 IA]|uniref:Uncharacterized protein n=1 Tax=Thanatephorus cucumeris (strain AG1-IA) TaxID=983506 RepID=L8WH68_THACA|nr:hypothetical protein AG1IA_10246 [Rhizoctonia solani AG-1 IA]